MTFNLIEAYHIKCDEKYDEYDLSENWEAILLFSDDGKVIGTTSGDNKQLIVGNYSNNDNTQMQLYRFFDDNGRVCLYQFPSEYSTKNDPFGTFGVFGNQGLGGLGNCYFHLKKYIGDYKEITDFYVNSINSIRENKDIFKLSIINQVFNPNINRQDSNINIPKK